MIGQARPVRLVELNEQAYDKLAEYGRLHVPCKGDCDDIIIRITDYENEEHETKGIA